MNAISNLYQFIYQVVVGRVHNISDLELYLNLMYVFGWIISSNDDAIHMCCNVLISFILVIFANPKVSI